ncbi:VOC family protein [Enterococcus villorum]|uniref:Extradiol dioxygenase n=2 Tax=Enterococcus villorum TaxID=112904 RepID=A0A511J4N7_9ENTE|nr:VOC family protein [Enterococcus villorum]EOH88735.1 glyoxalase [Enterococcus villorum ATCC 700913]EOW76372.1 glyoxalase [Enterococcus villorum ATCC 700913]GEL92967.1 extradiol dioxygenase [Enterococcus villorum]
MRDFKLGSDTYLKSVAIRVKDRDKMIDFYKNTIGFDLKREENELAILGTQEQDSEMLLLEESPRANDHFGEIKKLNRFSLVIPTVEELADILSRIRKKNYPIECALEDDGRIGILLKDPEENQLEIYHRDSEIKVGDNPEELDQESLLRQSDETYKKLSADSYFETIHLNVLDVAKQRHFLSNLLGLKVHEEKNGLYVLNEGDFQVGITEATSEAIALPTHEILGLDFLKFVVDQESMENLIHHLKEQAVDFFLDQKQNVLTIYDTVGIEWWFVLDMKKTKQQ